MIQKQNLNKFSSIRIISQGNDKDEEYVKSQKVFLIFKIIPKNDKILVQII